MREPVYFEIRTLPPTPESLGAVADFLAGKPPFTKYEFAALIQAIRSQLRRGTHVCAVQGQAVIGYSGWLPTTKAAAERWLRGEGRLTAPGNGKADAVALTIFAADGNAMVLPMIRAARKRCPGLQVFFKRSYANESVQPRKSTVRNLAFDKRDIQHVQL